MLVGLCKCFSLLSTYVKLLIHTYIGPSQKKWRQANVISGCHFAFDSGLMDFTVPLTVPVFEFQ